MRVRVSLLALVLLAGCGHRSADGRVALRAMPERALADVPVEVKASGLAPHAAVTLRATWPGYGGMRGTSAIALRADGGGRLDLRGVDGARFLWGMRVSPPGRFFALPATDDSVVSLSLVEGGRVVARAALHRRVGSPGLRARLLTKRRDGVAGAFFAPPGARRRGGAVLAVGGSDGTAPIDLAALLASHGHPALALAYFDAPGLPRRLERVPLEYFQRALRWLARQPSVDRRRIAMLGISRGAEPTLLTAIRAPALVHAAIALVPEPEVGVALDGRTPAWTYRGRGLSPQPIAIARVRGPILLASAQADAQAPSSFATRHYATRLAEHRFRFFHERLDYPAAGHDIGSAIPYVPQPDRAHFGGTPRATAAAKADLWPRILDFLHDHDT